MAKNIFVVTGLGYGDEGKGKVTHWLCSKHKAHTVVRTGGPQAFHRVVTSDGQEHVHAQFGSGTLAGAATHLSKHMVIDPYAIIAEGQSLKREFGLRDIFERLSIHEDALVITPFQAIANRLRELSRGDARHGSVGVGVGETVLDAEAFKEEAILAKDLGRSYLLDKLKTIRKRKILELEEIISCVDSLPQDTRVRACLEVANLKSEGTLEWAMGWFNKLASIVRIVNTDYVVNEILSPQGTVVFEGSQGVLLDRWYGFHPYTTKVRTTPETALSIIRECNYDGEVTSLGVLRAYHTRHGAGPFVSQNVELTTDLPDPSNSDHPWQGNFRVGSFDMVAAKYAIEVCTGSLDGLVITCLDRVESLGEWWVGRLYGCLYEGNTDKFFLRNDGELIDGIIVSRQTGSLQLKHQKKLGWLFRQCYAENKIYKLKESGDIVRFCSNVLSKELIIPIITISIGPTEKDCIEFTGIKNGQTV
ncbi:MAG: adenylosuccinate synthetase [bacterium]|nr:adenylosuccinate synthetase [bacterium]